MAPLTHPSIVGMFLVLFYLKYVESPKQMDGSMKFLNSGQVKP
jgi:hypothetical protein